MSLSNRTLGILIILGFIGVGYIVYSYFFVYNLVTLNIESNVENYDVELYNLKSTKKINCPLKMCSINEISPFEYDLKITKKDYETYTKKIDLSKTTSIQIDLGKTLIFEKIETNSGVLEETKKTRQEIISEQKGLKQKIFNIENIGKFIFTQNKDKLDLEYEDKIIGTFEKLDIDKLILQKVYSSENMIFMNSGDLSYILNLDTLKTYTINLKSNILYTKYLLGTKNIGIVTTDGTFLYNLLDSKITYFSKYSDFVSVDNYDIFILNSSDKIRRKNFSFDKEIGNLIVLFDQDKKTKKILKSLDTTISKIYIEDSKLFIENDIGEIYLIDNYK